MKQAQTFSMEFIVAVTIFIAAILLFYTFLNTGGSKKSRELQEEAVVLSRQAKIKESDFSFIDGGEVNLSKLVDLSHEDYEELKAQLGLQNEFCLYFKDKDGRIMYILSNSSGDLYGIGSNKISVDSKPCGELEP